MDATDLQWAREHKIRLEQLVYLRGAISRLIKEMEPVLGESACLPMLQAFETVNRMLRETEAA